MDKFFLPDQRKWISPVTNLGRSMGELKRVVRLRKDSLLVVDPSECPDRTSSAGPSRGSRSQSSEPSPFVRLKEEEEEASGMDGRAYMDFEAGNLGVNDVVIEAESERLQEELDRAAATKWMEDDAACEAALACVNGPDFFDMGEKAERRLAEVLRKKAMLVLPEGAGAAGIGPGSYPIVEEEDDQKMECDDDDYDGTDNVEMTNKDPEPCSSTSMYENYNSISAIKQEVDDEGNDNEVEDSIEAGFANIFPLGIKDECEEPEVDFENDADNFATAADRFDQYLKTRPDLLHSDSEDDDRDAGNSSDEEFYIDLDSANLQDGVAPVKAPPPPPGPATQIHSSQIKEATRSTLLKVMKGSSAGKNIPPTSAEAADTSEEGARTSGGKAGANGVDPNANFSEQSLPGASETDRYDAMSDFSRFTDWVFQQTKKKDEERRNKVTPDLMKKLNLSGKDVSHFLRTTSASLACVKGEVFQDDAVMKSSSMPLLAPPILPPASTELQSLAVFITHGEDPSCFPWKSINVQQQINDDFANDELLKQMERQNKDLADPAMKAELVDKEDDFLIQLLVYQATDPDDVLPDEIKLFMEPRPAYELHVLGSQTVRELMNAIHCENDFVYMKEVSHPDDFVEDANQFAKAQFPQSVMLIHETIYSSSSETSGAEFHTMINNWAKRPPKKNIGPFKSGDWNVQLRDLDLRFGFPYVYIHLGGCEHIIVFTKARLLHTEDNHLLRDYPKIHGMTRFKSVYCRVDNEYLAKWAVLDSKEFPENPMLLCSACVLMYCYDKQKKKQCDFRLFPFTQIANII